MADNRNDNSISMATKPQSGKGKFVWILLILAIVAGGAVWMLRDTQQPSTPQPTPEQSQMRLQLPAPPPQNTASAQSQNGTNGTQNLADGMVATGQNTPTDGESPNASTAAEQSAESGGTADVGRVMPRVQDDSVIRLNFIEDMAHYLADAYYPAGSGPAKGDSGELAKGPKMLNMHYGVEMTGLTWSGDDIKKGRQSVLRYVLNSTMADALYRLYVDRFMEALQKEAKRLVRTVDGEERPLTRMEIKEMHLLLSRKVMATAGVIRACVVMEDAMARVDALHAATKTALEANQEFQVALLRYQQAAEGSDAKKTAAARAAMDASGKTYQQAIMQRERTRESLANQLRKYKWVSMQDDNANIYIAQWVFRRMQENPRVFPALMTVQEKLLDLAERMEKRSAL